MQQQSPVSSHSRRSFSENHYPCSESNSFADTLYNNRRNNDLLLEKIIKVTEDNEILRQQVEKYKKALPPYLIKWWDSTQGTEKITLFIEKLNVSMEREMERMNKKLYQYRGEFEVNQADFEEELKTEKQLKKTIGQLEGRLGQLKANNVAKRRQLQELRGMKSQVMRQFSKISSAYQFTSNEDREGLYFKNWIESYFKNRLYQSSSQHYIDQQQALLSHIFKRKSRVSQQLNTLNRQIQELNENIDIYLREKEEKQDLKQTIIQQHQRVITLKRQLEQFKKKREEAESSQRQLEMKLTDENMEKAIEGFDRLTGRYQKLADRTIFLLEKSVKGTELEVVQRMISNQ